MWLLTNLTLIRLTCVTSLSFDVLRCMGEKEEGRKRAQMTKGTKEEFENESCVNRDMVSLNMNGVLY